MKKVLLCAGVLLATQVQAAPKTYLAVECTVSSHSKVKTFVTFDGKRDSTGKPTDIDALDVVMKTYSFDPVTGGSEQEEPTLRLYPEQNASDMVIADKFFMKQNLAGSMITATSDAQWKMTAFGAEQPELLAIIQAIPTKSAKSSFDVKQTLIEKSTNTVFRIRGYCTQYDENGAIVR